MIVYGIYLIFKGGLIVTRKLIFILSLLLFSALSLSVEVVQLKDGRKILIKEDFTWEEIITSDSMQKKDNSSFSNDVLPTAGGAGTLPSSASIKEAETKVLMEKYPDLLIEDLKGGVNVKVVSSKEEKNKISFFFDITNNSSSSVVRVEADILLLDNEGNILGTVTDYIYKGFNRMADTYIRVGKVKEGKISISKVDNWNGKVRVIIKDVESR